MHRFSDGKAVAILIDQIAAILDGYKAYVIDNSGKRVAKINVKPNSHDPATSRMLLATVPKYSNLVTLRKSHEPATRLNYFQVKLGSSQTRPESRIREKFSAEAFGWPTRFWKPLTGNERHFRFGIRAWPGESHLKLSLITQEITAPNDLRRISLPYSPPSSPKTQRPLPLRKLRVRRKRTDPQVSSFKSPFSVTNSIQHLSCCNGRT